MLSKRMGTFCADISVTDPKTTHFRRYLGVCNGGGNPTWPNISHGFSFLHNIVYLTTPELTRGSDARNTSFDYNTYFAQSSPYLIFPGRRNFSDWQDVGYDPHSLVADPLFVNVTAWDFRLKRASPALKLGFQQWDYTQAGTHGNPFEGKGEVVF